MRIIGRNAFKNTMPLNKTFAMKTHHATPAKRENIFPQVSPTEPDHGNIKDTICPTRLDINTGIATVMDTTITQNPR